MSGILYFPQRTHDCVYFGYLCLDVDFAYFFKQKKDYIFIAEAFRHFPKRRNTETNRKI